MGIQQTVSYQAASLEEIAKLLEEEAKAFEIPNLTGTEAASEKSFAKGIRHAVKVLRATTLNPVRESAT